MLNGLDACLIGMYLGQSVTGISQKVNTARAVYSAGYPASLQPSPLRGAGSREVKLLCMILSRGGYHPQERS